MKTTKKALALILAVMMAASLTACSSSSSSSSDSDTTAAAVEDTDSTDSTDTAEAASSGEDYSSWPEEDIHILYYTKAGSGGDTFLRQMAAALDGKLNGHSIVIENVIDTTGATTWSKVQEADPDGYTLAGLSTTVVTADIVGGSPVAYEDFEYVIGLGVDQQYIYCLADQPYDTLEELIAYCEENPGELNWATNAPTSASTVCSVALIQEAGINVNRVTYDTGSDSLTAILGGFVDVCVGEYADIAGEVEAGEIKLIATFSEERTSLEDVPTVVESGFSLVFQRSRGLAAPLGTDPALVERMYEVFAQCYEDEDFMEYLSTNAIEPVLQTGDEFFESYQLLADAVTDYLDVLTGTAS
ncbi:MAG: tripartite tricarboxylate transporter substrate binding protein [Lachnospiraceae bacterium]|nr:tripartite tricarboxylate transporter substrate binding protein [Lachnospiraceae bacterium]